MGWTWMVPQNTENNTPLTRQELIRACVDAKLNKDQWEAMTYTTGPYDIFEPTVALIELAEMFSGRKYESVE